MRLIPLTSIRTRYVLARPGVNGHLERFEHPVLLNPELIQYVMPMPPEDPAEVGDHSTGPMPNAYVGFGMEMEFQVVETVEQVTGLLKGELPATAAAAENDPVTIWVRQSAMNLYGGWMTCDKSDPGAHMAFVQPKKGVQK